MAKTQKRNKNNSLTRFIQVPNLNKVFIIPTFLISKKKRITPILHNFSYHLNTDMFLFLGYYRKIMINIRIRL
jgi:hypothetical protein